MWWISGTRLADSSHRMAFLQGLPGQWTGAGEVRWALHHRVSAEDLWTQEELFDWLIQCKSFTFWLLKLCLKTRKRPDA